MKPFTILFPNGSSTKAEADSRTLYDALELVFGELFAYVYTDPNVGNFVVYGRNPRDAFERLPKSVQQQMVFIPF